MTSKMMITSEITKVESSASATAQIPLDIIREILLWLPGMSLLRFKSVSKTWYGFTVDPDFAKLNYSRRIKSRHRLFLIHDRKFYSADCTKLGEEPVELYDPHHVEFGPPCPECRRDKSPSGIPADFSCAISMVGSSNGLICLYKYANLALFNPATLTHRKVPCPQVIYHKFGHVRYCNGFGYDPLSYDYKVILFIAHEFKPIEVKIYSLNSNTWRTAPNPMVRSIPVYFRETFVCANGVLYWFHEEDGETNTIGSFDIHDEKYREVPLPPYSHEHDPDARQNPRLKMCSINDGFCIVKTIRKGREHDQFEIWARKECGMDNTWSKLYTIRDASLYFLKIKLIGINDSGDELIYIVWQRTQFYIYGTRGRKIYSNLGLWRGDAALVESIPIALSPMK